MVDLDEEFAQEYLLLRKSVTCSICLEVFRNPVSLPCNHGFCESCILKALKLRDKCPMCSNPAKKNKLKHVEHLDDRLDLFRRLLATIDQSLKVRRLNVDMKSSISGLAAAAPLHTPLEQVEEAEPSKTNENKQVLALDVTQCSDVSDIEEYETCDDFHPAKALLQLHASSRVPENVMQAIDLSEPADTIDMVPDVRMLPALPAQSTTSADLKRSNSSNQNNSSKRSRTSKLQAKTASEPVAEEISETSAAPLVVEEVAPNVSTVQAAPVIYEKGTLVNVLPRTWAGINKLGGVGRIEDSRVDAEDAFLIFYRVKYVLDGHCDDDVPAAFVERFEELSRERRRVNKSTPVSNNVTAFSPQRVANKDRGPLFSPEAATTTAVSSTSDGKSRSSGSAGKGKNKVVLAGKENAEATDVKSKKTNGNVLQPKTASHADALSKDDSSTKLSGQKRPRNPDQEAPSSAVTTTTSSPLQRDLLLLTTCIDDSNGKGKQLEQALSQLCQLQLQSVTAASSSSTSSSSSATKKTRPHTISSISHFTDDVTHLIVSVDRAGVMKQRTMKYMQALAHGLWIVSTKWVLDSVQAGMVLDEAGYEVKSNLKALLPQAPLRARLASSRDQV